MIAEPTRTITDARSETSFVVATQRPATTSKTSSAPASNRVKPPMAGVFTSGDHWGTKARHFAASPRTP